MSTIPRRPGAYLIRCTVNNKVYVGSAKVLRKRKNDHWALLRKNRHTNIHLQRAWNKYGEEAFNFIVLAEAPIDQLYALEQHYIAVYDATNPLYGFNILPVAGSSRGTVLSEEHKLKVSASLKAFYAAHPDRHPQLGRSPSQSIRDRVGAFFAGKKKTDTQRAKMSRAATKRFANPENHPNYGKARSEETRKRIAAARAGGPYIVRAPGDTYYVANLKAFCATQHLDYGSILHIRDTGKLYRGVWSCRHATDEEIAAYNPYLGADVYLRLD